MPRRSPPVRSGEHPERQGAANDRQGDPERVPYRPRKRVEPSAEGSASGEAEFAARLRLVIGRLGAAHASDSGVSLPPLQLVDPGHHRAVRAAPARGTGRPGGGDRADHEPGARRPRRAGAGTAQGRHRGRPIGAGLVVGCRCESADRDPARSSPLSSRAGWNDSTVPSCAVSRPRFPCWRHCWTRRMWPRLREAYGG